MKISLIILVFLCLAISVKAENQLTDEEFQELIKGYEGFESGNGMNEPVSKKLRVQ